MLRVRRIVFVVCFQLALLAGMNRASAQATPAWMQVRRSFFLASEATTPAQARRRDAFNKPTRRAAYLFATGAGLVTAGVLHAVLLGRRGVCDEDERVGTAIPAGGTAAAAGLILTIPGAIMLARVPRADRRLKEIDGIGLIGAYLGAGAAASALLLMVAAPQLVTCVDS